ncbi:hypothetical protein TNCV_2872431 [Trichonephila clavipes]|nr:hypothetical protein TNCV_2872431 [Trichonephila clavipes]
MWHGVKVKRGRLHFWMPDNGSKLRYPSPITVCSSYADFFAIGTWIAKRYSVPSLNCECGLKKVEELG